MIPAVGPRERPTVWRWGSLLATMRACRATAPSSPTSTTHSTPGWTTSCPPWRRWWTRWSPPPACPGCGWSSRSRPSTELRVERVPVGHPGVGAVPALRGRLRLVQRPRARPSPARLQGGARPLPQALPRGARDARPDPRARPEGGRAHRRPAERGRAPAQAPQARRPLRRALHAARLSRSRTTWRPRIRRKEEEGHYRSRTPVFELPRDAEKPSPAGLRRILADLGLRGPEVLYVGDNVKKDMPAAQACGAIGVWAEYGTYVSKEYRDRLAVISAREDHGAGTWPTRRRGAGRSPSRASRRCSRSSTARAGPRAGRRAAAPRRAGRGGAEPGAPWRRARRPAMSVPCASAITSSSARTGAIRPTRAAAARPRGARRSAPRSRRSWRGAG